VKAVACPDSPDRQPVRDTPQNCTACHDFGSAHISNWNMAMADGSVRALSYALELRVHKSFASINGNDQIAGTE